MDAETRERLKINAENISAEIENMEKLAENKDYGAFWGKVKEIGMLFKENMFQSDREQLRNKFQSIIDNMKQQQQDATEQITQALEVLNDLAEYRRYDDFRQKARDISLMFDSLPLGREDKHELREKRRKIVDDAREQQKAEERVAKECISNAIDELDKLVRNECYKEFKDRAKEIPSLFKDNKTSKEDNENLWQRYQDLWQHVKNAEQRQISESERMKSTFYSLINKAIIDISIARTINDLQEVENTLEETRELTRSMLPHHRHDCLPLWHETKDKSRYKRKEIYETNFFRLKDEIDIMAQIYLGMKSGFDIIECVMTGGFSALADSEIRPHEALREIKDIQQKVRITDLDKYRRQELNESLQVWWDHAIKMIESIKQAKQQKHEAWLEKDKAWRERTRAACDRKQERLNNTEAYRDRLQDQIDKLEDDIENARNEKWAEKARGWLQEKYEKMKDVEQQIEQLKQEIDDINEKLGE